MRFKNEIAVRIGSLVGMHPDEVVKLLEVPPEAHMGDYAFPCFQLAKILRKSPQAIASGLKEQIEQDTGIEKVEVVGGYLNIFLNRSEYNKKVISDILSSGDQYGTSSIGAGKTVLVEFSSPNIAKPFHVGHLCSTVIGNSIEKIYKFLGYNTFRINHLGDWGTQFGKLISAYKRWGDKGLIQKEPIKELLRIYVKFHEETEKNPELEDEARGYFKKLEDGDPEAVALWKEFMELSLLEFKRIYSTLNIEFDSYAGESFYSDKMGEVVDILQDKKLLQESENAWVVNLEQFGMPPCLILKSDGATIYATRDLAAALYRQRTYHFDKCIYVVGTPQALHFRQVFSVLGLAGFEWHKDCVHVGFGLVKFADRKLSTRSGEVVFLEDVLKESVRRSMAKIDENNPNLENKDEVANIVGVGAVVYAFLKNGRDRDIIFSWEDTLDFQGESAPYVQYTYARGRSILRKAGSIPEKADYTVLTTDEEFELVKLMDRFNEVVVDAAEKYEPSIVTRYITSVARAFNKFYNACPILSAGQDVKSARLGLTEAVCGVIKTGMSLLGIEVPEKM